MEETRVDISVIVPFYNLERYAGACLDSVAAALSETACAAVEIICVDDGSADSTGAILDGYAAKDSRFRVIHKSNGGEGSARNAGLDAAKGAWVTFLDGDDVWLENHVSVASHVLAAHPDADIVAFRYVQFEDGCEPPPPEPAEAHVFDVGKEIPSEILLEVGVFPTFFRRDFLDGMRFSALPLGADRLFVAQCLARAKTVVKCDAAVHGYRIRAGSRARAVWNARKVKSQCDYAYGSLVALSGSGKSVGVEGLSYLASIWLSDVPNRVSRLKRGERREAWEHWRSTLDSGCVKASSRFDAVRRALGFVSFSMPVSLLTARLFRKAGVS